LDESIETLGKAVSLFPAGHPDKPGCFNNLGIPLQARFETMGELKDLEESIEVVTKAISLTVDGHPSKPGFSTT
jgi:hypothetical protein